MGPRCLSTRPTVDLNWHPKIWAQTLFYLKDIPGIKQDFSFIKIYLRRTCISKPISIYQRLALMLEGTSRRYFWLSREIPAKEAFRPDYIVIHLV